MTDQDAQGGALQPLPPEERLRDQLARLQADFENYRRRTEKQMARVVNEAKEELMERLLPVLDDFDHALKAIPADDGPARKGVEIISRKLFSALQKEGLERLGKEGEPFNAEIHEVAATEEGEDGQDDVVTGVLRSGYRVGERLLRPAKVTVAVSKR